MSQYTVSELWIYPIKSCKGIPLQSAEVTDRGFQYDRRWMIATEDGHQLTQRELPGTISLLYLRIFPFRDPYYGLVMPGLLYRLMDGLTNFEVKTRWLDF